MLLILTKLTMRSFVPTLIAAQYVWRNWSPKYQSMRGQLYMDTVNYQRYNLQREGGRNKKGNDEVANRDAYLSVFDRFSRQSTVRILTIYALQFDPSPFCRNERSNRLLCTRSIRIYRAASPGQELLGVSWCMFVGDRLQVVWFSFDGPTIPYPEAC